jgi:hypothetical protein
MCVVCLVSQVPSISLRLAQEWLAGWCHVASGLVIVLAVLQHLSEFVVQALALAHA